MILLVEFGFSPLEALQTVTLNSVKYLGKLISFGTIEIGKVLDFVWVDANPLENISNIKKVNSVFTNGKYLSRVVLDSMLGELEKKNKDNK